MLSDTGSISFLLYGFFVAITVIAMIVAFVQIKKGTIEMAKLDKMIELFKYAIVSTAITTVTLVVADLFKEREQDIKELEYFDKYIEDVKKVDGVQERLQLAKYLSIVAPNGEMKKAWKNYYDSVQLEYRHYLALKLQLRKTEADSLVNPTTKQLIEVEKTKEAIDMFEKPLAGPGVSTKKPVIYIQYCNQGEKTEAANIRKKFENSFWSAPGIEHSEAICDNSIRYFHEEDRILANQANTLLENKFDIQRSNLRAPKGQIELWIGGARTP